jgi:CheY-like chemotaxis protein
VNEPGSTIKKVLLAEDDEDDFHLFHEAVSELGDTIQLSWVKDGEELMKRLAQDKAALPDVIFLDINMPRKNGFECLTAIRQNETLKHLPVIIFSTSNDKALVTWMYNAGANLYLCKPTDFRRLKRSIQQAIFLDWQKQTPYPPVNDFVLT